MITKETIIAAFKKAAKNSEMITICSNNTIEIYSGNFSIDLSKIESYENFQLDQNNGPYDIEYRYLATINSFSYEEIITMSKKDFDYVHALISPIYEAKVKEIREINYSKLESMLTEFISN